MTNASAPTARYRIAVTRRRQASAGLALCDRNGIRAALGALSVGSAGLGFGTWLHGEAVAAGTILAARLSERMGLLNAAQVERVARLMSRAGLPTEAPNLGEARYLELMGHDKKVTDGKLRLVLLKAPGKAFVTSDYRPGDLRQVLAGAAAHA